MANNTDFPSQNTSDVWIKCRFCGTRFFGSHGELRDNGVLIGECEHCAEELTVFFKQISNMTSKEKPDKVYWIVGSEENKPYTATTWYRCVGGQNFVELVEKKAGKIVAIIFSDNNIGFLLDEDKKSEEI